jgi:hypothetical protein
MLVHARKAEPWKVTLVDTGEATLTGGRLARVRPYLDDEPSIVSRMLYEFHLYLHFSEHPTLYTNPCLTFSLLLRLKLFKLKGV